MDSPRALPEGKRALLGAYFLARLERLLGLSLSAIAAHGEPGMNLALWALRSAFADCCALGWGQEAALLVIGASQAISRELAADRRDA